MCPHCRTRCAISSPSTFCVARSSKEWLPDSEGKRAEEQEGLLTGEGLMSLGVQSALEYDSISYRRITFFIDDKATPMICTCKKTNGRAPRVALIPLLLVALPPGFPREKIALSIQSPFLARGSRTIARSVPGLPWGSRWTVEEFVKKSKYVDENDISFEWRSNGWH